MKKLLLLLSILVTISCDSGKNYWTAIKNNPRFSSVFDFAYLNRESVYLDSSIVLLNDSLSINKNFWLRISDDTIRLVKIHDYKYEVLIRKSAIVIYNINLNQLKYIDSIYSNQTAIDSMISNFIHNIEWGGFYIYSDTLSTKDDWKSLFLAIDKAKTAYQLERDRFARDKYGIKFNKIDEIRKNEIIKRIRLPIAIYFKDPFPPPPQLTDDELKELMENLNSEK
jgi:hypothetical protein